MICSRCGTNVPDGAVNCPQCGAGLSYQQPQGYGGQSQQAYYPPPAAYGSTKAARFGGPLDFTAVFMVILSVLSAIGVIIMPVSKYEHRDNIVLNSYFTYFLKGGDIGCKFIKTMLIAGFSVIGISVVLAVISFIFTGSRKAPAALRLSALALIVDAAAYIADFALYLHINGDDHADGELDLAIAPLVMIAVCMAAAVLSFYAASLAKREANN
ncbi:MAG: zinc ribbon domain-containing protein [Ruminococcus sp.]|nr:zinc ribbon domain-containing protein [Ruminococcus sp.]